MAATHRILDEFYEESFTLFALHSSLEDYAIAYLLNRHLKTRFKRLPEDLDIAEGISFPIFEWMDVVNDRNWTLIANICRKEAKSGTDDLFTDQSSYTAYYLLPEYKEVDYVIKIDGEPTETETNFMESVADLPGLIAAYALDTNKLKSKKNLIF